MSMAEEPNTRAGDANAPPKPDRNGAPNATHYDDQPKPDEQHQEDQEKGDSTPPTKPFYKRPWVIVAGVIVILVGGFFGVRYLIHAYHYESTDDAFIDGHVVQMSPKVSGYVVDLRVTDNQLVHQGDVLLIIDQRDYIAARDQAKAAVDAAQNQVMEAKAAVKTNQANLESAQANAKVQTANLERAKEQFQKGVLGKQDYDTAVYNAKSAVDATKAAEGNLIAAQFKLNESTAAAAQAAAQLRQAELNLGYTTLTAPITGRVTRRTVERGNYLQPGQALFALVEPNLWVTANYKETQLTHMQVGQPVTVEVDAYPGRRLAAHIDSFQRGSGARFSLLPAENATGNYVKVVQRIPVKIVFNDPLPDDLILGPGMSVVPDTRVR